MPLPAFFVPHFGEVIADLLRCMKTQAFAALKLNHENINCVRVDDQ